MYIVYTACVAVGDLPDLMTFLLWVNLKFLFGEVIATRTGGKGEICLMELWIAVKNRQWHKCFFHFVQNT